MAFTRFRWSLWLGVTMFLFLSPGKATAAGCRTDCKLFPLFPDCLTCGYRAFSDVMCFRISCDSCDTLSCTASLLSPADQWATSVTDREGCSERVKTAPMSKILKVQQLAARG